MELPGELYVRPVPHSEDLVAFDFPFELEAKALGDSVVQVLEDGDLIIEGWAARFEGVDREGENFVDGAFQRGIKSFLEGAASLCFHHKPDTVLGKVLELEEVEGKGLRMKARVDGAIKDHPVMKTIYSQIKKGTLSGLSVGGFFKRTSTPDGPRISDMDFTEISVTGVPVHAKPAFAVVAGKALEGAEETIPTTPTTEDDFLPVSAALDSLKGVLDALEESKAIKGDPQDLHFLAVLLDLERMTMNLPNSEETEGELGEGGGPTDARVDKLMSEVKEAFHDFGREAHKLAAKLGPLPEVTYV